MSTNFDSPSKKWCFMVYLAADIDLESAAMADLEQMKAAGSSAEVDLLAQINPGGSRPIRRYHLQKDTYLQEDLVTIYDANGVEIRLNNVNASQDLIQFVEWCAGQSKAEHYALILWGHGQGWKADNADPCFVPGAGNPRKTLDEQLKTLEKQRQLNPNTNVSVAASMPLSLPTTLLNGETGFLTNADLTDVLAQAKQKLGGRNIDILGFDACLMAMGEICCQVNESVNYLIACEDTVPDESWPYDTILKLLVANANRITAEELARLVVWKFIFDFGQKRKFVTQSICQLGADENASLNNFTSAVSRLVDALVNEINDPETRWATMLARSQVQSFYLRDYVDIYDYCRLLALNCKSASVTQACGDVMNALHNSNSNGNGKLSGLVVDHGTYGYPLKCSFGVSVYFPAAGNVPSCYRELEFCTKTRWHEFLEVFLLSPEGRPALFEGEQPEPESDWPNEISANEPSVPATEPAVAAVGEDNAAVETVTATFTPAGIALPSSNGSGGNGLKTTLGDVIKTSHGDPIKKPQLPFWMLPSAPKPHTTVSRGRPDPEAGNNKKP